MMTELPFSSYKRTRTRTGTRFDADIARNLQLKFNDKGPRRNDSFCDAAQTPSARRNRRTFLLRLLGSGTMSPASASQNSAPAEKSPFLSKLAAAPPGSTPWPLIRSMTRRARTVVDLLNIEKTSNAQRSTLDAQSKSKK